MLSLRRDYYLAVSSTNIHYSYSNTQLRPIYIDISIVEINICMDRNVTKPRIQKMHFSLLFFEHHCLAYYKSLASEIFNTQRKHSDLVNCVSDFLYRDYFSFYKIEKNNMNK